MNEIKSLTNFTKINRFIKTPIPFQDEKKLMRMKRNFVIDVIDSLVIVAFLITNISMLIVMSIFSQLLKLKL